MQSQLDLSTKPRARAALELAARHHMGTERKYTGEPYIAHPIRVAEKLVSLGWGSSEDVICAALLHDCPEDPCKATGLVMPLHGIEKACGARVARWTDLLTKRKRGNREATLAAYTQQLSQAPTEVQAIKLADILDNVTGLANLDPDFAPTYLDEKEAQAKALHGPAKIAGRGIRYEALIQISAERNQLAAMRLFESNRVADERTIAALVEEQVGNTYADYALF